MQPFWRLLIDNLSDPTLILLMCAAAVRTPPRAFAQISGLLNSKNRGFGQSLLMQSSRIEEDVHAARDSLSALSTAACWTISPFLETGAKLCSHVLSLPGAGIYHLGRGHSRAAGGAGVDGGGCDLGSRLCCQLRGCVHAATRSIQLGEACGSCLARSHRPRCRLDRHALSSVTSPERTTCLHAVLLMRMYAAILQKTCCAEGIRVLCAASGNDYQKDQQFRKLNKEKDSIEVKAVRGGLECLVTNTDVVVGDILLLDTGDKLVADGIAVEAFGLVIDEARPWRNEFVFAVLPEGLVA